MHSLVLCSQLGNGSGWLSSVVRRYEETENANNVEFFELCTYISNTHIPCFLPVAVAAAVAAAISISFA